MSGRAASQYTATAFGATLLLAVVSVAGCGTIFGGSSQEVSLGSNPSGTTVEFDQIDRTVTTPAEIELKRKHNYRVVFTRDGYETESVVIESDLRVGILVLDIFTGVIGVAVDAATGAWYSLSPDEIDVTLTKTNRAAGPEDVQVEVRLSGAGASTLSITAEKPVQVRIERTE